MLDALDEDPAMATAVTPSSSTVTGQADVSSGQETSAKRRKVRKGTRSCWECKRRKIRCIFASSKDATCIGCQRRRAPCVTQEMPENLAPAKKGNRHLSDRISRVEDFMKEYLAARDIDSTKVEAEPSGSSLLTPDTNDDDSGADETETTLRRLLAAFPAEEDARILLRESGKSSRYAELVNTQPHSKLTLETLAAPSSTAELPGPGTHPVILAKLMLMFAITLQSPSGEKVVGLSQPRSVLKHRLMLAATTWVTGKGEMHGTVEGLICIMLEGVFEVNSGNLRRAWAVYRRAMTVAQLMGLHRSPIPPLRRIDPRLDADPEFIWFRVVYMDRYLSLLLGLPQGTSDKSMGAMSFLQHQPSLGRFERLLTIIASRILERNESPFAPSDITMTQSIDSELLQASNSMPASFWHPADFSNLRPGSPDTLLETMHLSAQVYYFGLLIQLHLPYMMRISGSTLHEYSKVTCVNASREIMTRFIAHRTFNPMSSCSRPVDFFALLAAMTLMLAHLDAHHHREAINFLAHQRWSDRAMLSQALERMDVISNVNKDVITAKSAKLIRRLLSVEADAAERSTHSDSNVRGEEVQDGNEGGEELRLHIPYLGVIKIARHGPLSRELPPREPLAASNDTFSLTSQVWATDQQSTRHAQASEHPKAQSQLSEDEQSMFQYPGTSSNNDTLQSHEGLLPIAPSVNDWTFEGVDMAFFDNLMRGTSYENVDAVEQQCTGDPPGLASGRGVMNDMSGAS